MFRDRGPRFFLVIEGVSASLRLWLQAVANVAKFIVDYNVGVIDYDELVIKVSIADPQRQNICRNVKLLSKTDCEWLLGLTVQHGSLDLKIGIEPEVTIEPSGQDCDLDFVVKVLKRYLELEADDQAIVFEWAFGNQLDRDYGGGWAVITRHWVRWSGTGQVFAEALATHRLKGGNARDLEEIEILAAKMSTNYRSA